MNILSKEEAEFYEDKQSVRSLLEAFEETRWAVIDRLLELQEKWGEKFWQMADDLGLTPKTISNYMWVGRSIPPELRNPQLSYTAHRELAGASDEHRDGILAFAQAKIAAGESVGSEEIKAMRRHLEGKLPPKETTWDDLRGRLASGTNLLRRCLPILKGHGESITEEIEVWLLNE